MVRRDREEMEWVGIYWSGLWKLGEKYALFEIVECGRWSERGIDCERGRVGMVGFVGFEGYDEMRESRS